MNVAPVAGPLHEHAVYPLLPPCARNFFATTGSNAA
jgi:hypothetical protein